MNHPMMKKAIAFLLTLIMLVNLMPSSVLAENTVQTRASTGYPAYLSNPQGKILDNIYLVTFDANNNAISYASMGDDSGSRLKFKSIQNHTVLETNITSDSMMIVKINGTDQANLLRNMPKKDQIHNNTTTYTAVENRGKIDDKYFFWDYSEGQSSGRITINVSSSLPRPKAIVAVEDGVNPSQLYIVFAQRQTVAEWGNSLQPFYSYRLCTGSGEYSLPEEQMVNNGAGSRTYDPDLGLEVFLVACTDNNIPINQLDRAIYNNGSYNGYPVTITPSGESNNAEFVITIGNASVGPVEHTASISGLTSWQANYYVTAKVDGADYYAPINSDGTVGSFATGGVATSNGKLPDKADANSVKIVLQGSGSYTEITKVTATDNKEYTISGPELNTSTHDYHFEMLPPANVFVTIENEGDGSITLGNRYCLVVGWNDGPDSYRFKELKNSNIISDHEFYISELGTSGYENKPLLVLIKTYPAGDTSDPRDNNNGTLVIANRGLTGNPNTITDGNDQYRFTYIDHNGDNHYTIKVEKLERAKHTAHVTLAEGVSTENMYVVFRQPIPNSDEKAYCAIKVNGNGDYESTPNLINPNHGEQSFNATAETEVLIVTPKDNQPIQSWMFQKSNFDNQNGMNIYHNGDLYQNSQDQIVTITPHPTDNNKTNISIGSTSYTARLDLYDAWNQKHNGSVTFTEVAVTASKGSNTYNGTITSNSVFMDNLPADLTTWTFSSDTFGGYTLSSTTPVKEGTVYVFEAHKPDAYQVEMLYKEAWGEEEASQVSFSTVGTITATDRNGNEYYGTINTDGSVTMDPVPEIVSWQIDDNNTIGDFVFKPSDTAGQLNPSVDNGTHTYILTLRKARTHRVDIEYYDSWGRGKLNGDVPVGAGYTIEATGNGTTYTGTVDAATGKVSFEQELPDISTWTVKHNNTVEDPQGIGGFRTDFGPENPFEQAKYDAQLQNAAGYYIITATKPNTYSAEVSFYAADAEDPLDNVDLPERFVIKATAADGTVFTGTVETDGSVTWNESSTGWPQIEEFKFYKENGTDEVTRFGNYLMEVVSYQDTDLAATYGAYQIIGRAAKLYPSAIDYMPDNESALSAKYYLVASVEGEKVAYATVPERDSRLTFIPFGAATGALNYRMMLAETGNTPAAAGMKLPEDTEFTLIKSNSELTPAQIHEADSSPAVIDDYTLELVPAIESTNEGVGSADEDTLVLKAQKQWTGNEIHITTYGFDGQPEAPEHEFGDKYFLRVCIRNQETNAIEGWNLIPITQWKPDPQNPQGDTAIIEVTKYTTLAKCPLDPTTESIWQGYDPSIHYIEVDTDGYPARVTHIDNPQGIDWDKANNAQFVKDEPPEGYKYTKGEQKSNYYQIKLKKAKPIEYHVKLKFDTTDTSKINLDGGLYVKVTIEHQSGPDTYAWVPVNNANYKNPEHMSVDTQNGCTYIDIPITVWKDAEGHPKPDEKYKGTEENIKVELVGTSDPNAKPGHSTPMKTGAYVNNAEITAYPSLTEGTDRFTDEQGEKEKITDVVSLSVEPDKFDGYSLEYILNGYNIVTLCPNTTASPSNSGASAFGDGDFLMKNHCMGGVLVRGDIIHITGTGVADSEFIDKPSVVGGYVPANQAPFINNRENNNNEWNAYIGSVNTVVGNTVNGVTASGSPSKPRPDGSIRGYTGSAGYTAAYGDTYIDWDKLQQTILDTSKDIADAGRDPAIDWPQVSYPIEYTIDVALGDSITIDNMPSNVKLIVNVIAPEGLDLQNSKNIPSTVVSFTGNGTFNAPQVRVNGNRLQTVEDGSGMSLVWNYPDADQVNLTTDVTPFFGHIVAPKAYVNVEGGNYSGCMVGNKVSSAGEGHLYPYNGGKLVLTDVGFAASKTIDEFPPEADQLFYFELDELDQDGSLNNNAGQWVTRETVRNKEGSVEFEKIEYDKPGTYYYRINEYQQTMSTGITLDTTEYIVKSVVEEQVSGTTNTLTSTETYYRVPENVTDYIQSYTEDEKTKYKVNTDALEDLHIQAGASAEEIAAGLTFDNQSNDNTRISVRKTLTGETLQQGQFNFSIERVSAPDDNVGSVDERQLNWTATNNANGTVNFGKLLFNLKDGQNSGTWIYKVKETIPENASANYVYDRSEYEISFNVTRTNDVTNVTRSIRQVANKTGQPTDNPVDGINFTNDRKIGDLKISKTVVSPIPAEKTQIFSFKVQLQLDGKKLSGTFGNYTFDANGEATITVAGGSSVTIPGLPTGTTYTVIEAEDSHFTVNQENRTVSGTIVEGNQNTAAFTNTRKTGKISISKAVVSPIPAETTQDFIFTITLSDTTISETFNGTITGSAEPQEIEFKDGVATVTVAGGKTLTIEGLPTDLTYEIVEAQDSLFDTEKENDTGTITATGTTAAFTNTRKTGELKVEKQVTGTSDKSKVFKFTVTLNKDDETKISGIYPVDVTHVSGTQKEYFRNKNTGNYEITFDDSGSASFTLKADEYVIISGIPQGAVYTVAEDNDTTQSYPKGYELSSPNGSAQGTISATTSGVTFVNDYHLNTTSVGFGGTKSIEGTDSTEKVFTFELYQTGQDENDKYKFAENQAPIDTVSTTGTIGTVGQNYSFDTITYDGNDLVNRKKDFYYVVKEKALDQAKGWTIDNTEYKIHVTVTDDGEGNLTSTVKKYKADGTEVTQDPGKLDFKNTYEAQGTLKFRAKKIFTNGNLKDHPFRIRMTWVKGDQNPEAVPDSTDHTKPACQWTATLNANSDKQTVTFDNVKNFVKNKDQDDTTGEYWFLIEELESDSDTELNKPNIQYDANPKRWIKVTVTDNEDGTLKIEKDPATTASGSDTDLDVVFTNEQLYSIQVQKSFSGIDNLPDTFQITAAYTVDETNYTKTLKINANTAAGEIGPDTESNNPYTWTIDRLPLGTVVSFTESGYTVDGFTAVTTYDGFVGDSEKTLTAINTTPIPSGKFINTYTRDTGKIEIQKTVSVNDQTENIDTTLVDDTYTFHLKSAANVVPATDKYFTIKIENGVATDASFVAGEANILPANVIISATSGKVIISGLPTGDYTVTEELSAAQEAKGITIAEQPTTAITVDKYNTDTDIRTAAFRNNKEVGELEISKAVTGTTDKTKEFSFEVNLTAPSGITLENSYPAVIIAGTTKTPTTVTIANGKIDPNVVLKADEKLVIQNLPNGTSYTVKEVTPLPSGYEKIEPSGDPSGEISRDSSVAAFVNNYKLDTTSVAFGGLKTIEGTDSTDKDFCFELYETNADYLITKGPIQTIEITDTIQRSSGKSYSFDAITYSVIPLPTDPITYEKDDRGHHYYVIKEKVLDDNKGWTYDTETIYKADVEVTDPGNGVLSRTVRIIDQNGQVVSDSEPEGKLDFHNTYEATGKVSFKAKKIFTKGSLNDHPFKIKLTQVDGNGSTTKVGNNEWEAPLNTGSEQTVEFENVITFNKNSTTDDVEKEDGTLKEYWFLIEETDAVASSDDIDYDDHPQRWIKVTLTDNGNGTLIANKEPGTVSDGSDTDLDAVFTNEQLGGVKVSKEFAGLTTAQIPEDFKITASYTVGETNYTKILKINANTEAGEIGPDTGSNNPYTWTINNLPIDTEVTFTESGITVNGYSVETKYNDTATDSLSGKVKAAKDAPTGAFLNTYTRDVGRLEIQKTVSVNNQTDNSIDTSLVDGIYTFHLLSGTGVAPATDKSFTITINDGKATAAALVVNAEDQWPASAGLDYTNKKVTLTGLPTGSYTVTEVLTADQMAKGIKIAAQPTSAIEVGKYSTDTDIKTAAFRNNRDVGDLEIKKTVTGTTDTSKSFTFEVSLNAPNGITLEDKYTVEATNDVKAANSITDSKLSFVSGKATVMLKAAETIVIKNLPKGTTYTVTEINIPEGYSKDSPAGVATDTIGTGTSEATFVNKYSTQETSVAFGGTKYIEGRDSTEKVFTFELYETNEQYSTEGLTPTEVKTAGTISAAGQPFTFATITYKETDKGHHYYVVKEQALTKTTGWTIDETVYKIHVTVSDDNNGHLIKTIKKCKDDGTEVDQEPGMLNFTNSYEATGSVYFRAKKTFTNGTLSEHPFQIKLTQVEGEESTKQATGADVILSSSVTKTVNAAAGYQTVFFNKDDGIVDFIRNKSKDNVADEHGTAKEYWFLIEELDENHDESAIDYDDHPQQWIKVTLTDDGNGKLTAVKEPAATNGLDVEFVNEQLGSVKVSKEFAGLTTEQIPQDFKITAEYTVGNETKTVELTKSSTGVSGEGTAENPYVWEIKGLPIGTDVSFTESGMTVNGYSVETKFNNEVTAEQKGTVKAAKDAPTGAFLNTYTRDVGKLEIQKTVSVNNKTESIDTSLVDGTYTFHLQSGKDVAPITNKSFTITIGSGKATAAALVNNTGDQWPVGAVLTCENEKVILSGLPTGNYTVTEELSTVQATEGITIAEKPNTAIEVRKYVTGATIPTAAFRNNREVGDLEISKKVSGTSDKTVNFTFEITLQKSGDPFGGTYEVVATDAVKETETNSTTISADGKITFDATSGKATVVLKADEKITIKNLPVGISYKVEEKNIPGGYSKTKPAGAATDTITEGTKTEEFENQYSLGTTNMTFGGRKTISGTDSTKAVFTFELWKTGSDFDMEAAEAKRIQTVSTSGTIATTGQDYSFDPISYKATDKDQTFYYVVKETAKVPNPNGTGWTTDSKLYKETVTISDDGKGGLVATAVSDPSAAASELNFTNNYSATGTVSFKAKKTFVNGDLKEHPFEIRLTYVTGDGLETPVKANNDPVYQETVTLNEQGTTQSVEFNNVLEFVKNSTHNDTTNAYWFLIEELDAAPSPSIDYDKNQKRWIKVTLRDEGDGRLTAIKEPAATDDLDVEFVNEQLGSVKVQKSYKGVNELPDSFEIVAEYQLAGQNKTTLHLAKTTSGVEKTGTGTEDNPYTYTWTIANLPIGTEVTFTESGYEVNGYSTSTTYKGFADGEDKVLISAKTAPIGAFVNTYTRERGKLNLKKTVSVNGGNTKGETTLVDGKYTFNLVGSGLAAGENGTVSVTISKGAVTTATITGIDGATVAVVDGVAEISGLKTGQYTVTEDADTSGNFITSTSETRGTVTVESGENATIQTAAFNNNRDVGDLRISKTVQRTSNRTIAFEFTVTLTRKDNDTTTPLSGTYPVEATDAVKSRNATCISNGEITFDADGKAVIKLCADEELIIRNLPGKTNYTVHESTTPTGYSQTKPSGGGDATGTISSKQSEAAFENTYNLSSTNLPFSGKKSIEGTDSTEQVFEFEVYETGEDYVPKPGKEPILTAKTSGTITKATPGVISFGSVKYDQDAVGHEYYYVICEKALTENGWTNSSQVYKRHVVASDGDNGTINLAITDENNNTAVVSNLDFINTYVATGTLSFTARKTFTNGDLNSNPFQVKLTQVDGKGMTDKVSSSVMSVNPITKPVPADGIVKFESVASFTKHKDQNDTENTYWFMLEEDVSGTDSENIKDGVRYDTTRKWIKVTMTDDGVGHLIITKDPAATKEGETDIDADFVNEQLGSVKVSKVFAGLTSTQIPSAFKITAAYTVGTETKTIDLTKITAIGEGTTESPFTWTIDKLPIDTEVTFTESGMTVNGYSYTTTFNGKAASDHKGTTKAAKTAPDGAFINTYTRDRGTLVIKKIAAVPDGIPIPQSYTFTVKGEDGLFYGTNGTSNNKAIELKVTPGETGLKLVKLPTQKYTVTEVTGTNNAAIRIKGCNVTVNGNDQTVSISKNTTETVTVTNSYTMKTGEKTVYDSVDIYKEDKGTRYQLDGAEFTLYSKDTCDDADRIKTYSGKSFDIRTDDPELKLYLPANKDTTVTLYLKETKAPECYVLDTTIYSIIIKMTVSDPQYDETKDQYITTTTYPIEIDSQKKVNIPNKKTEVRVQKTDVATGEELTGAHIQILDKDGKVVNEWDSDKDKPHIETGLKTGEEYTLRETVAPEGYTITADTKFTIDEKGGITYSGTMSTDKDGNPVMLVEDTKGPRVSATVKKIWNDEKNRDGKRPANLTIQLLANGEKTGKSVTLSDQNGWIGRISELPKYNGEGKEIKYSWAEPKVEGYTLSSNTANGTLTTLTNTYTPETTQINVRKVWVDDGQHPNEVKVQLYADGQALGEAVKLDEGNGWKCSWNDLCKYDAGGEIRYTVAETEVPKGYAAKITGSMSAGYVITNTLQKGALVIRKQFDIREPEKLSDEEELKTEIQVVKIWDDNDNKDGNRPEKITIRLYAGGQEVKTAELSEKNGWKRTFGDLPKFVDGHPIRYSVKEDPVKWYVTEIKGFTITNRYQPEMTSVAIRKAWDDAGNEQFRPKSVIMKLNNGMSIELNEKNGWSGVITDLPKYVNGKEAEYTWSESEVLGYQIKSTVVEGNLTVITNAPFENDGTPKGKKPASRGEKTVQIDDYRTPLGVSEMINHVGDCFD